jgi:hypothetical protein
MASNENFLEETLKALERAGKTTKDILWCGSEEFGYCSWDDLKPIMDFEYDSGYGSPVIPTDLLIVGEDFWLERREYDGSEWWAFVTKPEKPKTFKVPESVKGGLWDTLAEVNSE